MNNYTKQELDAMYADYVNNGLRERCPADPGPERHAWNVKRLYLACRMMATYLEEDRPEHLLNKAASRVGIATREAGWAVFEGAFKESMQDILKKANEEKLSESEMTHFSIEVIGRWEMPDGNWEFTGVRNVIFSARLPAVL